MTRRPKHSDTARSMLDRGLAALGETAPEPAGDPEATWQRVCVRRRLETPRRPAPPYRGMLSTVTAAAAVACCALTAQRLAPPRPGEPARHVDRPAVPASFPSGHAAEDWIDDPAGEYTERTFTALGALDAASGRHR